jgi:hypothetical protein
MTDLNARARTSPLMPRARTGQRASPTPITEGLGAPAPEHLSPITAALVERVDTGHYFLRAYMNGRYCWQPVADPVTAIPDTGTWLSSGEYKHAYWYNHGPYRRRAGQYYPVVTPDSAAHTA